MQGLSPDFHAPGLRQLLALQREGASLFHAVRAPPCGDTVYPSVHPVSLHPVHARGLWSPRLGLFLPPPTVRDTFACAWAAAALALSQAPGGERSLHCDEFPDGMVALTLAEFQLNRGAYREVIERASELEDDEPLGHYYVNVLQREAFPPDRLNFPIPGMYVSLEPVGIEQQVQLTAGDARAIVREIGPSLPWIETLDARSDPFIGPYRQGGQLQFDPLSGEQSHRRRVPTDRDAVLALIRSEIRERRWLERMSQPEHGPGHSDLPASTLRIALQFIDEHRARPLSMQEIAEVSGLSQSHLHAVFRASMGCTPFQYLADRRLDRAEQLLMQTELSVTEISEKCGFAEPTSLTRCLKRRRGITPALFRRSCARGTDRKPRGRVETAGHSP